MGSMAIEAPSPEAHQPFSSDDMTDRAERARWLLNSPDPPGCWHQLLSIAKEAATGSKRVSSDSKEKTSARRAVSLLQGLFPIVTWAKNYKASMFKRDLMAGLTLASLSIPQVRL